MQSVKDKRIHEKAGLVGVITFKAFKIESKRAKEIDAFLGENAHKGIAPTLYRKLVAELEALCSVRELVKQNLVVLTGREVLAKRLVGESAPSGEITFGAVGTGTAPVAAGNTTLDTEVKRKGFAVRARTNASVTIDFYYSKTDVDGTLTEFGTFIDAVDTPDDGVLYNRVLTGGWVKSDQEALTVTCTLSVNPA